jgi:hypothetical protein
MRACAVLTVLSAEIVLVYSFPWRTRGTFLYFYFLCRILRRFTRFGYLDWETTSQD